MNDLGTPVSPREHTDASASESPSTAPTTRRELREAERRRDAALAASGAAPAPSEAAPAPSEPSASVVALRDHERRAVEVGAPVVARRPSTTLERRSARRPAVPVTTGAITLPVARRSRKRTAVNMSILTIAAGIVATMAIPAYAFTPSDGAGHFSASAADRLKLTSAQSITVDGTAAAPAVSRDAYTATSNAALEAQAAAAAAAARASAARQTAAVSLRSYAAGYSGPSVSDFLANPPYPSFSLSQVFSVGQQYIGTPYIYGGSTPAGFDCSGFIMFVYAQFGISLPHSVSGQAARGTRISINDAQPGDVVIMSGHDGFYAGNGMIMDAPKPGGRVSIRPIWTDNFYIVRMGI